MEDLHMNNTSQDYSFNYSNIYDYDYDSNNTSLEETFDYSNIYDYGYDSNNTSLEELFINTEVSELLYNIDAIFPDYKVNINNISQTNRFYFSNITSNDNTSEAESFNLSNIITNNNNYEDFMFIMNVIDYIVISVGLPLILVAIYALYCQVRNGQVAPIYVINLLITDLIQLCWMIIEVTGAKYWNTSIVSILYDVGLMASVGFMVCVALERYLVVAWPLWYRFRRTIKTSVVVCVVVWITPLVCLVSFLWVDVALHRTASAVFLLLPLPLFIFFLGGTLKALSASTVPSDEKRRIVGVLVLVLLIYTLLFMPYIIRFLTKEVKNNFFYKVLSLIFLRLSPLADLFLYVFMRKGVIDKLLASVCCCRMDSNDISRSSGNDDNIHTVSSV